jgi:hypothetical protein
MRVRIGKLPEDEVFAAVQSMDPHAYSTEWKDRHFAQLKYDYDWWNDHFEISTSYSLPKLNAMEVLEIMRDWYDDLVHCAVSSYDHVLIWLSSARSAAWWPRSLWRCLGLD